MGAITIGRTLDKDNDSVTVHQGTDPFISTTPLIPANYDEVESTYTGVNLTSVVYKLDGVAVATLILSYTDGNLTRIQRQ